MARCLDAGPVRVKCPSYDMLFAFVQGTLAGKSVNSVHEHIAVCDACRTLVAEMARYPTTGDLRNAAGARKTRRRLIALMGAGGVIAVAAVVILALPRRASVVKSPPCTGGDASYHWIEYDVCYTRHDEPRTWEEARADCHARGAELFFYTSYNEPARVYTQLSLPDEEMWIGMKASTRTGAGPGWVTGEPLPEPGPSWAPGQPSFEAGACALQFVGADNHAESVTRYRWSLAPCDRALPYVCRKPGWIVRESTGHAYRVFRQPRNWDDAVAACAAEGAHLATLDDADEDAFVGARIRVDTWIGANDRGREGRFVWLTGSPVTHRNFGWLQPDDPTGNDDCVSMGPDRLWSDRNCRFLYAFVCEHDQMR